ncbi:hypothetical protein [Streptomyces sp. NPDC058653]|uniref:hypothetical protein n=1 Tax=Streptomyces sp. NPDC058653 TaxID=3346576 RepID=UPI003655773F
MSHPANPSASVPPPDESIMKRLGYIRLLHRQAITQSYAPAPLNFSSVLLFHDVMEYFFIVAVAHLGDEGIDLDIPFSKNVKKLRAADGNRLSYIDAVRRVGDYRNGFKHGGSIPGVDQVEETRRDVTLFLENNCPRLFDIDFADISMLHIVPQQVVRGHLKTGRSAVDGGDIQAGMAKVALAFDHLMSEWGNGKYLPGSAFGTQRFDFSGGYHSSGRRVEVFPTPSNSDVRSATNSLASSANKAMDDFDVQLETLRHVLRLQIAGIDMAGYARFAMITPHISMSMNGQRDTVDGEGQLHYTPENYDFCEMFVVKSALQLGESDFAIWMPQTYGDWDRAREAMDANGGRLPDDMQ